MDLAERRIYKMKILFICKHNRFRSRVATSFFNKINKNKKNKAKGAGIYSDYSYLDKDEVKISKELGIDIRGKPKKINSKLLKWQNRVIIVADNVKKSQIKDYNKHKITLWKIHDVDDAKDVKKAIKITIKKIMKKVERLVKELR